MLKFIFKTNFKFFIVFLLFTSTGSAASSIEEADSIVGNNFTNYIMRAFESAGESPNHFLFGVHRGKLNTVRSSVSQALSGMKAEEIDSSFQTRELKFVLDMIDVALQTINSTENYYSGLGENSNPHTARVWQFSNLLQSKEKMLKVLQDYLKWVHNPENLEIIKSDRQTPSRLLHLVFSLESMFSHRFNASMDESDLYRTEVLEPLSEMVIEHMHWLNSWNADKLASHNSFLLGSMGVDGLFRKPLTERLLRPENMHLWLLNKEVEKTHEAYAGLKFILSSQFSALQSEDVESKFQFLLDEALTPAEKEQFYKVSGSYFPEAMYEFVLTAPGSLSHYDFLSQIISIKNTWKKFEMVLTSSGLNIPSSSPFEAFMYVYYSNLDRWHIKGINDLVNVTHAFFAGYLPPNSEVLGQPFRPNVASVFASLTNSKTIIGTVIYNLSKDHPFILRSFFERFLFEFLILADQVEKLSAQDISQLNSLFRSYATSDINSNVVEEIAKMTVKNLAASVETRKIAGHFLLRIDKNKYSYVEDILKKLRSKKKILKFSPWGPDVTVLDADEEPTNVGTEITFVSPYSLNADFTPMFCKSLLK